MTRPEKIQGLLVRLEDLMYAMVLMAYPEAARKHLGSPPLSNIKVAVSYSHAEYLAKAMASARHQDLLVDIWSQFPGEPALEEIFALWHFINDQGQKIWVGLVVEASESEIDAITSHDAKFLRQLRIAN